MKCILTLAVCLSALTAAPAVAQHPAPKPNASEQSAAEKFAGQWEGTFETDHSPPGVLRMTFARDTIWKITVDLAMDRPIASESATDFKVDGSKVTWNHGFMGGTCRSVAVHDADTLKGQATCDQGAYTFTLVKK
jgi:hypothetical protein